MTPTSCSTCGFGFTNRRSASSATRPSTIRRRGRVPTIRWCTSWPRCCAKRTKLRRGGWDGQDGWRRLMLTPADYAEDETALFHPLTRQLMRQIDFRHGGPDYDRGYPDGIPTTVEVVHAKLGPLTSGLVMYPAGHARCESENLVESAGTKGAAPGRAGRRRRGVVPSTLHKPCRKVV